MCRSTATSGGQLVAHRRELLANLLEIVPPPALRVVEVEVVVLAGKRTNTLQEPLALCRGKVLQFRAAAFSVPGEPFQGLQKLLLRLDRCLGRLEFVNELFRLFRQLR